MSYPGYSSIFNYNYYIAFQNEGKTRLRSKIGEAKKTAQREPEDWDEILECFLRNSVDSACPNTAKGMFVNFELTERFLRPRSEEI